jgi:hypothetical protein
MLKASSEEIDAICQQFKVLVEEFGCENITIALPHRWKSLSEKNALGRVSAEFCTEKHIIIRVAYPSGCLTYEYAVI